MRISTCLLIAQCTFLVKHADAASTEPTSSIVPTTTPVPSSTPVPKECLDDASFEEKFGKNMVTCDALASYPPGKKEYFCETFGSVLNACCGTCSCADDASFERMVKKEKVTCDDVAGYPPNKKDYFCDTFTDVAVACGDTCDTCGLTFPPTSSPTTGCLDDAAFEEMFGKNMVTCDALASYPSGKKKYFCENEETVLNACPVTCGACPCVDDASFERMVKKEKATCDDVAGYPPKKKDYFCDTFTDVKAACCDTCCFDDPNFEKEVGGIIYTCADMVYIFKPGKVDYFCENVPGFSDACAKSCGTCYL